MLNIPTILAVYMRPIGVGPFSQALFQAAQALELLCHQMGRTSLKSILARAGIISPGKLNGWTIPDALWLAACKGMPSINLYPLGEISERAFKRTFIRLAFFVDGTYTEVLDSGPEVIQQQILHSIELQKVPGVLQFFLTDFFYEICRDFESRKKTGTKMDACYLYHFPHGKRARSLADEREYKTSLLNRCRSAAGDCLPALSKSLDENSLGSIQAKLIELYKQAMGRSPKLDRTPPSPLDNLNVIAGSRPTPELKRQFNIARDVQCFRLDSEKANIAFDVAPIERALAKMAKTKKHKLHSLSKDLLEVGTVVYFADQMVKREPTLRRSLDIRIPVRHVDVWDAVKESLIEAVSFLGRDEIHFHFSQKRGKQNALQFQTAKGKRCVALLSGGLDSAAGAVWTLANEYQPVFISHYSNGRTAHLQSELATELELGHNTPLPRIGLAIGKAIERVDESEKNSKKQRRSNELGSPPKSPMIQFLRSFLFLSIASVVAVESKINQIYLFENGPVALNPMFSEGRVNTRTAHPRFLELFQKLIRALFKVKLEIQNPFLYETKGEVVSRLAQPEFRGLVRKTCSCWNWFSVPIRADRIGRGAFKGPHDGDCLPCVIRRASVEQAKLAGSDVSYLMDVFDEFSRLDVPHQVLIADYLRFCRNVEMLEGDSLLLEHPDFSICAQNVEARGLIAMYQRHAREMIRSFCEKGSPETVHMLIPAEGVQGADPCDSIKVHGEHYIK